MMLLIDIGNTRSKLALADASQVQPSQCIEHADLSLTTLVAQFQRSPRPDSVWISCVGPDAVYATIEQWLLQQFGLSSNRVLVSGAACGLVNGYQEPDKLGVDRWVAAVGARQIVNSGDVLVVDAGTAVTIDWLDLGDVYQGGVIIPGYDLMHRSLTGNTAGIDSNSEPTEQLIGKTTQQCVNAGLSYGLVGAVEKIIFEMTAYIARPVSLVLTGGGAKLLASRSNIEYVYAPQLVMHGLSCFAVD